MLKIAWSLAYCHSLPAGHRFPMEKYELIPAQLLHEGTITEANIHEPSPLAEEIILLTHDEEYWKKLKTQSLSRKEERKIGFPQGEQLTSRELIISQGTIDCCKFAFEHGVALNVAGGTHHAYKDSGEGFCLLNDFAIAANYLLENNLANNILIIDLDVHQGNGTAKLFENEKRVFTFSMHGANNYPFHKEQSDLDIALPDQTGDEVYLSILKEKLPEVIQLAQPDIALYVAGVDVIGTDKLGKLNLSRLGCKQRDQIVLEHCKSKGIPLAISMAGGYSPSIAEIVDCHCNTFRLAKEIYF